MTNDLVTNDGEITRTENSKMTMFTADKEAMDKIKRLNDEDFEKEIEFMDEHMQTFLRLARNH